MSKELKNEVTKIVNKNKDQMLEQLQNKKTNNIDKLLENDNIENIIGVKIKEEKSERIKSHNALKELIETTNDSLEANKLLINNNTEKISELLLLKNELNNMSNKINNITNSQIKVDHEIKIKNLKKLDKNDKTNEIKKRSPKNLSILKSK